MKKKLTKIWGIGMIVVLLATLLVVGATPAAAGDLTWTTSPIPAAPTFQVAAGTDAAFVKVAPNGDIFAVDTQAAVDVVYKSVNGGLTWTASAPVAAGLVDLAVSPAYETDNTVLALAAGPPGQAYISTNGGATFAVLGGAVPVAAEVGTSLAVSPTYSGGTGEIMIGTQNPAAATFGDVYIWGRLGVLNWVAQGLGEDVMEVGFSPNYPIDATILAVSATAANTFLHSMVTGALWDATIGGAVTITDGAAAPGVAITGVGDAGNSITSAAMTIPSDFNGSLPLQRTVYVAVCSASALDRINRLSAGDAAGLATFKMTPSVLIADAEMTSLGYSGTAAAGTLVAGSSAIAGALTPQVYACANPAALTPVWTAAAAPPTGTAAAPALLTYIALANDYATSSKIYVGTVGANSALSVTDNGGFTFYQTGLIDTAIAAINDYQTASATEQFMVTNDGAGTADSVWKTTDGGLTWVRIMSPVLTGNTGIIRLSPDYATDMTVYLADLTSAVAGNIMLSNDGGATWAGRTCPIPPGDVAVKDQFTFYVSSSAAAVVTSSTTGGWTWQIAPTAIVGGGIVNDLELDLATGHLLAGDVAGAIFLSMNNNITWVPMGAAAGGAATVAFDANYATNNTIYRGDTTGVVAGIGRYDTTSAPGTPWALIDGGLCLIPTDILVAPDGTLYASDITASGGIVRSLTPTAPPLVVAATFERVASVGDGLPIGDTLAGLALAEGSNILYAINNLAIPNIRTYTDTLSAGATPPVTTGPAAGDVVNNTTAPVTLSWEAVTGALSYNTQWDTREDYATVRVRAAVLAPVNVDVVPLATFPAGVTVYWQVRVLTPVMGPYSAAEALEVQLAPAAVNAPAIIPAAGGAGNTGPGGTNVSLNPTFQWGTVPAATGFEIEIADNAAMENPIIQETLGNVTAYQLVSVALDYSTTYYWRVRGVTATSTTDWSPTTAFTTMAEPVDEPTITFTEVPQPTFTVEIPTPTVVENVTEEVSPAYIWAIIIIGAVLVIAVIVLIVRTRRSV